MSEDVTKYTGPLIVGDNIGVYIPIPYSDTIKPEELSMKYAYIIEPYYFLYRGWYCAKGKKQSVLPGIYQVMDDNGETAVKIIYPSTEEDRAAYLAATHYDKPKYNDILQVMTDNEDDYTIYADGKNMSIPEISATDDTLKEALKAACLVKGISVDSVKDRFSDRNAVFNFKQVMKGDGKFSILLFDRGCDAFNLGYYITLVDKDPEHPIGRPLNTPEAQRQYQALMKKAGIVPAPKPGPYAMVFSNMDGVEMRGDI